MYTTHNECSENTNEGAHTWKNKRLDEPYVHYIHNVLVEGADTYYNRYFVGAYTICTSSSAHVILITSTHVEWTLMLKLSSFQFGGVIHMSLKMCCGITIMIMQY